MGAVEFGVALAAARAERLQMLVVGEALVVTFGQSELVLGEG
jgi:hypothetical protein